MSSPRSVSSIIGLSQLDRSRPALRRISPFVASVPALPGCHTQAKSLDKLMERIHEAIELCLEVQGNDIESLDFVGIQRVTVAA